jgi:hypothetical protein
MGVMRLRAWCLDSAAIPREVDMHVVEPNEPPLLADMAAPVQAVAPPHISTLAYPSSFTSHALSTSGVLHRAALRRVVATMEERRDG